MPSPQNAQLSGSAGKFMEVHMGKLLEGVIRKRGVNISALARNLHVNRRTVYNWFAEAELPSELIEQISKVIAHDFYNELPVTFPKATEENLFPAGNSVDKGDEYWKNKYIALLERYAELLAEKRVY
ncbi:hypothetical protein ACXZ1K_05560 [Pedobacter sp. PWIIR3]